MKRTARRPKRRGRKGAQSGARPCMKDAYLRHWGEDVWWAVWVWVLVWTETVMCVEGGIVLILISIRI